MNVFSIVFVLTVINFIFQADFVILMPLGQSVMDHFNITTAEYSSVVGIYPLASGLTSLLFSFFGGAFRKKRRYWCRSFFWGCRAWQLVWRELFAIIFHTTIRWVLRRDSKPTYICHRSRFYPRREQRQINGLDYVWIFTRQRYWRSLGLFLASNFGFELPFKVFGAGFLLIFILSAFLLPSSEESSSTHHPIKELLEDFKDSLI